MKLRPIKSELDYQNALKQIEKLFDAEPDSPYSQSIKFILFLFPHFIPLQRRFSTCFICGAAGFGLQISLYYGFFNNFKSCASVSWVISSFSALASLDPGFSPTTT